VVNRGIAGLCSNARRQATAINLKIGAKKKAAAKSMALDMPAGG
jgi:hypothetical protein